MNGRRGSFPLSTANTRRFPRLLHRISVFFKKTPAFSARAENAGERGGMKLEKKEAPRVVLTPPRDESRKEELLRALSEEAARMIQRRLQ